MSSLELRSFLQASRFVLFTFISFQANRTTNSDRCRISTVNGNLVDKIVNFTSAINKSSWRNDISHITSGSKSIFYIYNPRNIYHVRDEILVRIQARDMQGRNKTFGGDYFRARMVSPARNASVNPNGIVDRGDGTYDAHFTIWWPGRSDISVILVHPAEAVSVIRRAIQQLPNRLVYSGLFVAPWNHQVKETVPCDVIPPEVKTLYIQTSNFILS